MFSVIFEVHPGAGRHDSYLEHAKLLKPELEAIDGFIDNERFASRTRAGWVLSLSTWRDEKSVIRWRSHGGHHLIQAKGRNEIFSDYHLRVGEITADTHPPAGASLAGQRFDETEIGESKCCTLIELTPQGGADVPVPAASTPGLVSAETYESIYNPGKLLLLLSWQTAAHVVHPALPSGHEARVRDVRVIRTYGMFDRRETPQFYPPISR